MTQAKEKESLEKRSRLYGSLSDLEDERQPSGSSSGKECSFEWINMDIQLNGYHCKCCGKVSHSQQEFSMHAENCQESCLLHCKDCREVFPNSDELNRHKYLFHSLDERHSCGRCLKKFSSRKKLVKHIQKYDFQCKPKDLSDLRKECSETLVVRQSDECHSVCAVITESKTLVLNRTSEKRAELSNENQVSDITLKQYLETRATVDNCYKCATCDEISRSFDELIQHIKDSHSSGKAFISEMVYPKKKDGCLESMCSLAGSGSDSEDRGVLINKIWVNMCINSIEWTNMIRECQRYQCVGCRLSFHTKMELKLHSENCQESYLHLCGECEEVFPNSDELNRHKYLFHSLDKHHPCGRCLKKFSSKKKLVKHIKKYDFQCKPKDLSDLGDDKSEITAVRQSEESQSIHSMMSESNVVIGRPSEKRAELCNDKQKGDLTVKPDLDICSTNVKCHKCATCDEICKSRKNLLLHMKETHSSEKAFICRVCQYGFTSRIDLGVHQYFHDKQFTCDVCGKGYLTKLCYKLHTKICQEKRVLHRCEICRKEYSSQGNLKKHMFQHSTEKTFACTQCPARYKLNSNLRTHVRVAHLKIKPHECGICHKKFSNRRLMRQHYSVHSDERPFKCSFCEKHFKLKSTVRIHEKNVHFGKMSSE